MMKKIGIIADTHFTQERKLHLDVIDFFSDVSLILHAGDIGDPKEFKKLKRVAPVIAVMGNKTEDRYNYCLKDTEIITIDGLKILLTHGLGNTFTNYFEYFVGKILQFKALSFNLMIKRLNKQTDKEVCLVVFGHLHQVYVKYVDGRLFVNPGAAYTTSDSKRVGSVAKVILRNNHICEVLIHYLIP